MWVLALAWPRSRIYTRFPDWPWRRRQELMPSNCSGNASTTAVSRPTFLIVLASADAPLPDPCYSAEILGHRCLGVQYLCDFWQHFATADRQLQVQHKRWQSSDRNSCAETVCHWKKLAISCSSAGDAAMKTSLRCWDVSATAKKP